MKTKFNKFKKYLSCLLVFVLICTICCGCNLKSAEAKKVDELILAIGQVTLDSESAILAVKTYYDSLTDEQKSQVENYGLLESAINTLDSLKRYESIVLMSLQYNFSYAKISGGETDFKVTVAKDGLASTFSNAKHMGYDENLSTWMEIKQIAIDMVDNIKGMGTAYGLNVTKVTLTFADDTNYDNSLLIIQDDVVTYDFMAD